MQDHCIDIRESAAVTRVVSAERPEIVFHLAAQPLVQRSYKEPLETWATNVVGTANLLDACRKTDSVRAIVVITSDKCYENREWVWGYREMDRLGGHDPYSASKAATELVAESYRKSFFDNGPLLATARAGNVIGGGDWSEDYFAAAANVEQWMSEFVGLLEKEAIDIWSNIRKNNEGVILHAAAYNLVVSAISRLSRNTANRLSVFIPGWQRISILSSRWAGCIRTAMK